MKPTIESINEQIKQVDTNLVSDGFHTFSELYAHRIQLWIALCKAFCATAWRSERHSDGELAFGGGWFVLGINILPGKQLTYHLPLSYWDECSFAHTLTKAPEWDGHSSNDVLERLKTLSL